MELVERDDMLAYIGLLNVATAFFYKVKPSTNERERIEDDAEAWRQLGWAAVCIMVDFFFR